MPLNKVKPNGNMYSFLNDYPRPGSNRGYTWNTIKGKCPHDCAYCYMKKYGPQKPIRFDESELKTDMGSVNFIFVGSSCDMWAEGVQSSWIARTLNHCINQERGNRFLFQSKNPRFYNWAFPRNTTLGTTIETNRVYPQMGNAPSPRERANAIGKTEAFLSVMVTIEPIMDFDLEILLNLIGDCRPNWVNIGADSGSHNLPEPPRGKVLELIAELQKFTEVKIKNNLKRIMGEKIL